MPRYFLQFAYNGAQFHGWQKQDNASSVQEKLEAGLSTLLRDDIEVVGAGRTDTGVHARQMVAHFDLDGKLEDQLHFVYQLNGILGTEIAIDSVREVKEDAHARFDALSRTYHYHLLKKKDPFLKELAYYHSKTLDVYDMNQAAKFLLGKQDFTSFSRTNTQTKTNLCDLKMAEWVETDDQWIFKIKADRFLRNMVRAIVGTLIEVGEGKRSVEEIMEVVARKDRRAAGASAPAHALYLEEISYPEDIYI